MNLHNLRFSLGNIAIWVNAYGLRYRTIGTHLWMLAEGQPVENIENRPVWQTRDYWVPERFAWTPFTRNISSLFNDGWVRPLCNKNSTSRRPRGEPGRWTGCTDCARIARERGIIAMTVEQAKAESTTYAAIRTEAEAWRALGRPEIWPPETT